MWLALAVSTAGALVTLAGVLAVRRREEWARQHKIWFVSFAAGILIALGMVLHKFPEGLVTYTFVQRVFGTSRTAPDVHCCVDQHAGRYTAFLPFSG